MTKDTIQRFLNSANLQTEGLAAKTNFVEAEVYDDYAVLDYALPIPLHIEQFLDIIEDIDHLVLAYHASPSPQTGLGSQLCAYAELSHEFHHKFNASADECGMVSGFSITLFEYDQDLGWELLAELENRTSKGWTFHYSLSETDILLDFIR